MTGMKNLRTLAAVIEGAAVIVAAIAILGAGHARAATPPTCHTLINGHIATGQRTRHENRQVMQSCCADCRATTTRRDDTR